MPVERETTSRGRRPIERKPLVKSPDGGTGGLVAAVIAAGIVVLVVLWLTNGFNLGGTAAGTVAVDAPAVTITTDGQ